MHRRTIISIFICICLCCSSVWAAPLAASRQRRQVVQPMWLMRPDLLPSSQAAKVSVTSQNLQDVASLRANIQKAVSEGRYAVADSPQQFLIALGQMGNTGQLSAPMAVPVLPAFTMPNATWWPFLG